MVFPFFRLEKHSTDLAAKKSKKQDEEAAPAASASATIIDDDVIVVEEKSSYCTGSNLTCPLYTSQAIRESLRYIGICPDRFRRGLVEHPKYSVVLGRVFPGERLPKVEMDALALTNQIIQTHRCISTVHVLRPEYEESALNAHHVNTMVVAPFHSKVVPFVRDPSFVMCRKDDETFRHKQPLAERVSAAIVRYQKKIEQGCGMVLNFAYRRNNWRHHPHAENEILLDFAGEDGFWQDMLECENSVPIHADLWSKIGPHVRRIYLTNNIIRGSSAWNDFLSNESLFSGVLYLRALPRRLNAQHSHADFCFSELEIADLESVVCDAVLEDPIYFIHSGGCFEKMGQLSKLEFLPTDNRAFLDSPFQCASRFLSSTGMGRLKCIDLSSDCATKCASVSTTFVRKTVDSQRGVKEITYTIKHTSHFHAAVTRLEFVTEYLKFCTGGTGGMVYTYVPSFSLAVFESGKVKDAVRNVYYAASQVPCQNLALFVDGTTVANTLLQWTALVEAFGPGRFARMSCLEVCFVDNTSKKHVATDLVNFFIGALKKLNNLICVRTNYVFLSHRASLEEKRLCECILERGGCRLTYTGSVLPPTYSMHETVLIMLAQKKR